jgi:hydrogenase maturation protein HypF
VSFLLGLCDKNTYEAQAAIQLENAAGHEEVEPYPYETRTSQEGLRMSLSAAVRAILRDRANGAPRSLIASRFHETVARMLASTAIMAAEQAGVRTIVLAGGCFANRRLRSRVINLLHRAHFQVVIPNRLSFGDAGLALGQAVIAAAIHERTG